jgi:hypothetical protein
MSWQLFRAEDLIIEYCDEGEGIIDQIWANYYGFVNDSWF